MESQEPPSNGDSLKKQYGTMMPIFVQNPSGASMMGFPPGFKHKTPPPTPPGSDAGDDSDVGNYFLAPGVLLRGVPRNQRLPSLEDLEGIYEKNKRIFLMMMGFTVAIEMVLLVLIVLKMLEATKTTSLWQMEYLQSPRGWLVVAVAEAVYNTLFVVKAIAAFPSGTTKDWRILCGMSLFGMAMEVAWIPLTWRLNIITFLARGILALYSRSIKNLLEVVQSMSLIGRRAAI